MASKAGYDPIPDIEKGAGVMEDQTSTNARYPQANELEAELLGLLDACVDGPKADLFTLPELSSQEVESGSSNFLKAMAVPTFLAFAAFADALYVHKGPGLVVSSFPYVVALAVFCASAVSMYNRIMTQVEFVVITMGEKEAEEMVQDGIDSVAEKLTGKVNDVEHKLNEVVLSWQSMLRKAGKSERELKQIDGDIIFPESERVVVHSGLDGASEGIGQCAKKSKIASSGITEYLPARFTSSDSFKKQVVFPVLFLCLVLQMIGAFVMTLVVSPSASEDSGGRLLRGQRSLVHGVQEQAMGTNELNMEEAAFDFLMAKPLVFFVVEIYAMSLLQVGLAFFFTRPAAIASIVNDARDSLCKTTTRVLREQGMDALCEDIFVTQMGLVKRKVLSVMKSMDKIESAMIQHTKKQEMKVEEDDSPFKHIQRFFSPKK